MIVDILSILVKKLKTEVGVRTTMSSRNILQLLPIPKQAGEVIVKAEVKEKLAQKENGSAVEPNAHIEILLTFFNRTLCTLCKLYVNA